jgi:hypothetical protein
MTTVLETLLVFDEVNVNTIIYTREKHNAPHGAATNANYVHSYNWEREKVLLIVIGRGFINSA